MMQRNHLGIFTHIENGQERWITRRELMVMASKKIKDQYPDTPGGKLFFAILDQAIKDTTSTSPTERERALIFLKGESQTGGKYDGFNNQADMCDVNPEWVREVLTEFDCFEPLPEQSKWFRAGSKRFGNIQAAIDLYPAPEIGIENYAEECRKVHELRQDFAMRNQTLK